MEQTAVLDKRAKEIEQEYLSSLADLNVNSKPLINMLTILAEENLEYAHIIVAAVEKHLAKVVPDVKLPILYLVDSIVKNVGKEYQSLFSQVIVPMFCGVFETVNEKIREKMFSLRQTWNEVFPQSKLYTLDIKINSMDPGWPITAQLKPKIHFNPMFLKGGTVPDVAMQQQLQDKHRELLELQARKLELELAATKKRIEEQEKQLSLQTASVAKEPTSQEARKPMENTASKGLTSMMSVAGGGSVMSTAILPPVVMPKSRIAPVPQAMINMVKTRDPRLAKQQAAAQLVSSQSNAGIGMGVGGVGGGRFGADIHSALGQMLIPPPVIVPGHPVEETSNHAAPVKLSVKDRLGARVRRIEPTAAAGGSASRLELQHPVAEDSGRSKKQSPSSSSLLHKSRQDSDNKSKKDRKEHSSSSSTSSKSSSTRGGGGGSMGKVSSSSSSRTASRGGGTEKRKQRTQSNSDSSPQDNKSPHHSPGKKKSSLEKTNYPADGASKMGEKSLPSKGSPSTSSSSGRIPRMARNNSSDGKKQDQPAVSGEHHHHHHHHHHQAGSNNDAQDMDLRFSAPEKRMKIDESSLPNVRRSLDVEEKVPIVGQNASDVKNVSATEEEEAVSAMIAKDIDLRSIPLHMLPGNKRAAKDILLLPNALASDASKEGPVKPHSDDGGEDSDGTTGAKKRSSTNKFDEPSAKKTKAEMLDALFGNEDVDLRQIPIGGTMLEASNSVISVDSPEPGFPKLDSMLDPRRSPLLEKNGGSIDHRMDVVRGKFSEVGKTQEKDKLGRPLLYNKLPDDPIERRRSISSLAKPGDIDLRRMPPLHDGMLDQDDDDNSMDSMNANIKTIIAQTQEQMDKGEISLEQYNMLMNQVIQLNETQKIRQAQRIEHGKQQDMMPVIRIDDNGSLSGEDDVIVTSVTPASSLRATKEHERGGSGASSGIVNDFRGKIHPIDGGGPPLGKVPFDAPFGGGAALPITSVPPPDIRAQRDPRRQRESKWNRVELNTPWPSNRSGAPVVGGPLAVAPLAGGIRPGMAVPSPWEKAPFPVAGVAPPRFPPVPAATLPPIGIVVPGVGAAGVGGGVLNGQSSMLLPTMAKMNDSVRTINIDGIQREIRFYEETAVIFMNWDEPKEIGFQKGARMVVVDGRETFELGFNEPYKSVSIDNKVYQMRLGAPTRELYIDDSWYECYFGDAPTSIFLDGKLRIFKIAGPAPQVKIGESRNDLVAGKINMVINAEIMIPVFLDCKVQTFEIHGHTHTLQFADFLLTMLIDEQPYPAEFGKLPKVYRLREGDYYVRFTSLPKNLQPGNVYIRDMIRTPLYRDLRTPPKDPSALLSAQPPVLEGNNSAAPFGPSSAGGQQQQRLGVPPPTLGAFGGGGGGLNKGNHPMGMGAGAVPANASASAVSTGLDYLTNLMPSVAMQTAGQGNGNIPGYRIEADEKALTATGAAGASSTVGIGASIPGGGGGGGISLLANINVEELYKKIVASGILTKPGSGGATSAGDTASDAKEDPAKVERGKDKESKPAVPAIEPVLLDKPDTLKKRQAAIVYQLFSGMQCSSCGVRFPPEQTMKYSQHLDWHFRQNRRDRDSARKAHSRKWYYDVSDWIQYEEIEDLEEREKNWFETQQAEQCDLKKGGGSGGGGGPGGGGGAGDGDDSSPNGDGSPQPSCPAGSDEDDRQCHMCHEVFEQFYNEETEEWHLKCAIRVDGSTYHPLCYEDYKASLTMSETTLENTTLGGGGGGEDEENLKTDTNGEDGAEALDEGLQPTGKADAEGKKTTADGEGNGNGEDEDDDDDVIVLPATEPVVEEILDDDADEPMPSKSTPEGSDPASKDDPSSSVAAAVKSPLPRQPEFQERQIDEDLFIQEPNIEVTDLDEIEDQPASTTATTEAPHSPGTAGDENSLSSLLRVKIKEEPKEDDEADEEDALFEEVGTIESSLLEINEHRSPMETNAEEGDLYEDVIVESIPSPAETSNQTAAIQPAAAAKPSLDGNVELQDAPQASVVVPNRIKINITKSKAATIAASHGPGSSANETTGAGESVGEGTNNGAGSSAIVNSNFNENSQGVGSSEANEEHSVAERPGAREVMFDELSNDAVGSWGEEVEENKDSSATTAVPAEVAFEETTNVAYELKEALKGVEFNRRPRVTNGSEASGLCSIM